MYTLFDEIYNLIQHSVYIQSLVTLMGVYTTSPVLEKVGIPIIETINNYQQKTSCQLIFLYTKLDIPGTKLWWMCFYYKNCCKLVVNICIKAVNIYNKILCEDYIGPMHEEKIMGKTTKIPTASFWFHFWRWEFPP